MKSSTVTIEWFLCWILKIDDTKWIFGAILDLRSWLSVKSLYQVIYTNEQMNLIRPCLEIFFLPAVQSHPTHTNASALFFFSENVNFEA